MMVDSVGQQIALRRHGPDEGLTIVKNQEPAVDTPSTSDDQLGRSRRQAESAVAAALDGEVALRAFADRLVAAGRTSEAVERLVAAAEELKAANRSEPMLLAYSRAADLAPAARRVDILRALIPIHVERRAYPRAFLLACEVVEFLLAAGDITGAEAFLASLPPLGDPSQRGDIYRRQLDGLIAVARTSSSNTLRGSWLTTGGIASFSPREDFSALTVLLVDDDPMHLALCVSSIEPLGCQVVTATDGVAALEAISARRPTLVISDLVMPSMDGSQLFERLQAEPVTEAIPFVCLSSRSDEREVIAALLRGVEDYWTKPIRPGEFRARIHRLLRRIKDSATLGGSLGDLGVTDLLQMLEANRRTGSLLLESGGQTAVIYLADGRPVDAAAFGKTGETAVYAVVGWQEGRFQFSPRLPDRPRRIFSSAQGLLLEAIRRLDEWRSAVDLLPADHSALVLLDAVTLDAADFPEGATLATLERLVPLLEGQGTIQSVLAELAGELESVQLLVALFNRGDVLIDAD